MKAIFANIVAFNMNSKNNNLLEKSLNEINIAILFSANRPYSNVKNEMGHLVSYVPFLTLLLTDQNFRHLAYFYFRFNP